MSTRRPAEGAKMDVLLAETFGFLIILFVLYRYVWPILSGMATKRQEAIAQQVAESEAAARNLEDAQRRLESALAEARGEVARIRDTARADAERIREELHEQAEREAERIRQRGEEQLVASRDQVVRQVRAELGELMMTLTERITVESLSDEDRKASTVNQFLDELEQMAQPAPEGQDERKFVPAGAADEAHA
ncbi:MAG: F0F1 ATP synthase subunit B [Actinomycetota bacterium]|nr:F0F1 ATP synthase subunit B [Actinomycetota bacterium]